MKIKVLKNIQIGGQIVFEKNKVYRGEKIKQQWERVWYNLGYQKFLFPVGSVEVLENA